MHINDLINGDPPVPTRISEDGKRYGIVDGKEVQLRADGMPRRKPGRKPGAIAKSKHESDDINKSRKHVRRENESSLAAQPPRKRKIAPAMNADIGADSKSIFDPAPDTAHNQGTSHQHLGQKSCEPNQNVRHDYIAQKALKLETSAPYSMQSILNEVTNEERIETQTAGRPSGQRYDPIRGNYTPVHENFRHAVDLGYDNKIRNDVPLSAIKLASGPPSDITMITVTRPAETRGANLNLNPLSYDQTMSDRADNVTLTEQESHPCTTSILSLDPVPFKHVVDDNSSHLTEELGLRNSHAPASNRKSHTKQRAGLASSNTPVTMTTHVTPPVHNLSIEEVPQGYERSILDFGKASPGEQSHAPNIVLDIPIKSGETNLYVNFLRMAEECYGWDALHPRQAANRDRKARIAAASAALEKAGIGSGRESGDDMSVDLSDIEASNVEIAVSGIDAPAKPVRKKRNFKEDEYDVEDDFVDDSELQWENQAAASRDGFFVYMGPLVREADTSSMKASVILESTIHRTFTDEFTMHRNEAPTRGRGRRGGGPGSRGGRGGTARGNSTTATTNGPNRGGGPGSRGGTSRKSRGSKIERTPKEKAQRDKGLSVAPTPSLPTSVL
jgi:hypothetical protein